MTLDPVRANVWTATVPSPDVDPPSDVPKQITVTASDFENNQSTPASVTVNIHPIIDALAPTLAWQCGNGSMYPAAANAVFTVKVTPAAGDSINTVSITITAPGGPQTFPMTLVSGSYQYTYTVPSAADGTVVPLRVVATTFAGKTNSVSGTLTIIGGTANTFQFAADATISAAATQYENGIIIVSGGVLTIAGAHHFTRLAVLAGAIVVHPVPAGGVVSPLDITATTVYVACNGAIEGSQRGYGASTTFPGATPAGANNGGSHIGLGAALGAQIGTSFGNVYHPFEAGAGGDNAAPGGGAVHITSTSIVLDGVINANGEDATFFGRSGAGGSVWITSGTVLGTGSIGVNSGQADWGPGSGGSIAVEYASGAAPSWKMSAKTRPLGGAGGRAGGSGTILIKGPQSAYGDLTVDNGSVNDQPAVFPSLGSGVAAAGSNGATLVTDRAANLPTYFAGNWVEITNAAGVLKGTWRIASVTPNSKTVTLAANGSDVPLVQPGDRWNGVYRFDNLIAASSAAIQSADPIRLGAVGAVTMSGPTASGQILDVRTPIYSTQPLTVTGVVSLASISAPSMHVLNGSTLTGGSPGSPMKIDVVNLLAFDTGSAIDVSLRGYGPSATYPGATPAGGNNGGSHLGLATALGAQVGTSFGSVYHPAESGAGADNAAAGGGAVQITSGSIVLDGTIRANGGDVTFFGRSGAGGAVWITSGTVLGTGSIETNSGLADWGPGGGGAIAVEYGSGTAPAWTMSAKTRPLNGAGGRAGGAGTVLIKGPQSVYGDLTVDNQGETIE